MQQLVSASDVMSSIHVPRSMIKMFVEGERIFCFIKLFEQRNLCVNYCWVHFTGAFEL